MEFLAQGRRRSCWQTKDPSLVIKRARTPSEGPRANTREWFLWHWIKLTSLEPFFVPVIDLSPDAALLTQQRVQTLDQIPVTDRLLTDLDLMVQGMGTYLNSRLRNKRGQVDLHPWGVNLRTLHCQLYDYEHLDREQIALTLNTVKITVIAGHWDRLQPRLDQD